MHFLLLFCGISQRLILFMTVKCPSLVCSASILVLLSEILMCHEEIFIDAI